MTNLLRSDSPTCRRIVLAFLDFLNSVQPAPGVDLEGVSVVKDCLGDVFKLNVFSTGEEIPPGVLIDLFSSPESAEKFKPRAVLDPSPIGRTSCTTSASQQVEDSSYLKVEDPVGVPHDVGIDSKDELLGKFFAALDKINYMKTSPSGDEDPVQIAKATQLFNDAVKVMENSQGQISNLAETFKLRGNQTMQSKLYDEAIEQYTFAIALSEKNAVNYGNRAAAFTQVERYAEAIEDCLKAIKIDPSYSKAYSRLGFAYFYQGNYREALDRGFLKAVQLDPNNNSLKENIRAAQLKLAEQSHRSASHQNTGSNHATGSTANSAWSTYHSSPCTHFSANSFLPTEFPNMATATHSEGSGNHRTPSASFTFDGANPPDVASLFRTMAFAVQGHQSHATTSSGNPEETNEPEIRRGANDSETPHEQASTAQSAGSRNHGSPFPFFPIPPAQSARPTNRGGPFPPFPIPPAQSSRPTNHGGPFPPFPIPLSNMFRASRESTGPTSTSLLSFPFSSSIPTEFVDMLRTMGPTAQSRHSNESRASGEPEIRMDTNVSFNFGAAPEQVSDALRSMMRMFAPPPPGPQQDVPSDRN